MKIKYLAVISIVLLISVSSILGSQVIRFKSGSCLVAQNHRIDGKMIFITIEGGNEVGFPLSLVDEIEDRAGQTLFNKPLFLKKNSATGKAKVLSAGDNRFPPGFTAETDSVAMYRANKTKKAKEGTVPGILWGPRAVNAKDRLRSVSEVSSMGSQRGTTTTSYQQGKYSISIKTSRTRSSGKQKGGNELKPKLPE
jgi:hypothetical protein